MNERDASMVGLPGMSNSGARDLVELLESLLAAVRHHYGLSGQRDRRGPRCRKNPPPCTADAPPF